MLVIYREFQPSPTIRSVVERLWWLEGPADAIAAQPIPPDGHTEIIVHGGDPFAELGPDGKPRVQGRVLIAGQTTRAVRLAPLGYTRVVGARLRPDGAHALFGAPQHELTDRIADLRDIHRGLARVLRDDASGRGDGEGMVGALDRALCAAMPSPLPSWPAVTIALRRRGLIRVGELARQLDLGVRQLERVFQERVGVPPKLFLRIIRFQQVLRAARFGSRPTRWADLAISLGFYDQAHFIRDFKMFVGESPGAWNVSDESLTALFSSIRRAPEPAYERDVAFFQDAPPASA